MLRLVFEEDSVVVGCTAVLWLLDSMKCENMQICSRV